MGYLEFYDTLDSLKLKQQIDIQKQSFTNSPQLSTLNDYNNHEINQTQYKGSFTQMRKVQPIFKNSRIFSPQNLKETRNNLTVFTPQERQPLKSKELIINENTFQKYEDQNNNQQLDLSIKVKLDNSNKQSQMNQYKLGIVQRKRRIHSHYMNESFNIQVGPIQNKFDRNQDSFNQTGKIQMSNPVNHKHQRNLSGKFRFEDQSQKQIDSISPSLNKTQIQNSYSRTLMSQRFQNQNIISRINQKIIGDTNFIKSSVSQRNRHEEVNKQKSNQGMQTNEINDLGTNIKTSMSLNQNLLNNKISSKYQIFIKEDTQTSNKLISQQVELKEPKIHLNLIHQSPQKEQQDNKLPKSILSNLLLGNKKETYETLSIGSTIDEKCIAKNVFNVISNPISVRSSMKSSNNYYQVISPRDFSSDYRLNEQSQLFQKAQHPLEYDQKRRIKSRQSSLSNSNSVLDLQKGKFVDYESIKEYFHKHENVKSRFDKNDMNILDQMNALEFLILHRLFPKIYSLTKRQKSKNPQDSQLSFNPSHMQQYEIFLVKSEVYLHTEQFEKAEFFLVQGLQLWGTDHYFEFTFNMGLLHYLKGNYHKSSEIYLELLESKLGHQQEVEDSDDPSRTCIIFNLLLSLIREGKQIDVIEISNRVSIQKVRMTLDKKKIELQKLIIFAEQHSQKQNNDGIHNQQENQEQGNLVQNFKVIQKQNSDELQIDDNPIYSQRLINQGQDQQRSLLINYKRFSKAKRYISKSKQVNGNEIEIQVKSGKESPNISQLNISPSRMTSQVVNKVRFQVERIRDANSPEYLMSMKQIIQKLQCKGGIENNKHLQYQLNNLDEVMKQNHQTLETDNSQKILAFPFQKSQNQIKNSVGNENEDKKFNLADQCLRNMEELELEVSLSQGGSSFKKYDPILQHYKALCNSIYNLCQEEGLFEILQQAADQKRTTRQSKLKRKELYPGAKPKEVAKYSVAKDILVSSLLKKKHGIVSEKNQNDSQLVEIEILQSKVHQLKESLREEIEEETGKHKSMEYIDQAEQEINKMLAVARKKQREREKYQNQDQETNNLSKQNSESQSKKPFEDLIKTKTLQYLLRRPQFQEEIAKRFKVDRQKYLLSQLKTSQENLEEIPKVVTGNENLMNTYRQTQRSEIEMFVQKSKDFLDYVFDTYGAFYICQRTFCMSDFLDYAPDHIKAYFRNVSLLLTTIPMRFEILTDNNLDDSQYSILENTEFVYNRYDLIYKLISSGMRQQRYIDYLGLEKHDWIVEVIQKFNMISILNYIFREALSLFQNKQQAAIPNISEEDKVLGSEMGLLQSWRNKNMYNTESLKLIRDQFAKLKHKGSMNVELVDKFLGSKIPMFQQFQKQSRIKIYQMCEYKTIKDYDEIQYNTFSPNNIIVIIHGSLNLQLQKKEDSQWETYQVLSCGSVLPAQFLYYMKVKNHNVRLVIQRGLRLHSENDDLEYLEIDKTNLSNSIFKGVKDTLLKKIQLLQNVDLLGGVQGQVEKNDLISPYALFVLASLSKVHMFKFSEIITKQDEVPSGLNIILEGSAQAVFEDLNNRKGDVSQFFRKSMKVDEPKSLKFGLEKVGKKQHVKNIYSVTSKSKIVATQYKDTPSQLPQSTINPQVFPAKSNEEIQKENNVTFQNFVLNQNWQDHQQTKTISYKHHIIFEKLLEGSYFGSRVVLDDAAIKNFIKNNQEMIRGWLRNTGNQYLDEDQQEQIAIFEEDDQIINQVISQDNQQNLKHHQEQFSEEIIQLEQSKIFQSQDMRQKLYDKFEDNKILKLKNYLLRSQLTIVATSSVVKLMVIQRSDKTYFNETTKKILEERISEKEYLDVDRPIKKMRDLLSIRDKERQWDKYKLQFEEQVIKESFHSRFDKQIFK